MVDALTHFQENEDARGERDEALDEALIDENAGMLQCCAFPIMGGKVPWQRLARYFEKLQGVNSGGTILGDRAVALILDVPNLVGEVARQESLVH
jgi:hypothetical protein